MERKKKMKECISVPKARTEQMRSRRKKVKYAKNSELGEQSYKGEV
jgi:hypothetical protein